MRLEFSSSRPSCIGSSATCPGRPSCSPSVRGLRPYPLRCTQVARRDQASHRDMGRGGSRVLAQPSQWPLAYFLSCLSRRVLFTSKVGWRTTSPRSEPPERLYIGLTLVHSASHNPPGPIIGAHIYILTYLHTPTSTSTTTSYVFLDITLVLSIIMRLSMHRGA